MEISANHPSALLGLSKSLLAQAKIGEALTLLLNFPPSREYSAAEILRPLAEAMHHIQSIDSYSDEPLEAAFYHSIRLINKGMFPAAMDGLLDILRQDKRYRGGEARQVLVGLFEVLGETPLTRQYRQELSSILF